MMAAHVGHFCRHQPQDGQRGDMQNVHANRNSWVTDHYFTLRSGRSVYAPTCTSRGRLKPKLRYLNCDNQAIMDGIVSDGYTMMGAFVDLINTCNLSVDNTDLIEFAKMMGRVDAANDWMVLSLAGKADEKKPKRIAKKLRCAAIAEPRPVKGVIKTHVTRGR